MAAAAPGDDTGSAWARYVGGVFTPARPGLGLVHLDIQEHHTNFDGSLHGGVIASLMDSAAGAALHNLYESDPDVKGYATIEMSLSLLRPLRRGERVEVEARVIRQGRSLAVLDVDARSGDGDLVAKGRLTYLTRRGEAGEKRS